MLQHPSTVRYAARRVLNWRQQGSAVVLELEGIREPDATGIAAILAGAPLDDAVDLAHLTISVLESGAVRLQLCLGGVAGGASGGGAAGAGLLDTDELTPAPISATTNATADGTGTPPGTETGNRLHLASERHGGLGPDPEDIAIEVTLDPFELLVKDAGGKTVAQLATTQPDEHDEYRTAPFAWLRWTDDAGHPRQATTISLTLAPDERLAGLGERAGPLNLVDTDLVVAPMAAGTGAGMRPPLLLSSSGYGLMVHTATGLSAELGTHAPAAYSLAVTEPLLDVLLLPGNWPRTSLATYARLTGRIAVPEQQAFRVTEAAPAPHVRDTGADEAGASTPAAQPSLTAPATVDDMRALLRRGLSFGLTTPGHWRAPLGPGQTPAPRGGPGPPGPRTGSDGGQPTPLQIRWAQLALLCPLVVQTAAALLAAPGVRPYAALRHRLLPYLLHCARETAQSGLPMLRPLLLEFSWDAQAAAIDDQFLLGRDLLVAPIFSDSAGPVTRQVHLPLYANWYDWWTGTFYTGGQTVEVTVPLERLPIYVRAGTTIPLADPLTDPPPDPGTALPDLLLEPSTAQADAPVDVTRLLLFAPHDGAIGASVELGDDDLMGVEQERGERKARVYMEGIPRTLRDIEIIGLPASAHLVDASAPSIAIVSGDGDGRLPGIGGTWASMTIRLEVGAFTAGLELGW